jgi:hypothetical protein
MIINHSIKKLLQNKKNYNYFIFLFFITLIIRYPYFNYSFNSDDAVYLNAAIELKNSIVPYNGISDNSTGPLLYYSYLFLYYLFGSTIFGFKVAGSFLIFLNSWIVFKILKEHFSEKYSFYFSSLFIIFVTHLYYQGFIILPGHIAIFFSSLSLYFLIKKEENFFFLGFFISLAGLVKQSYIIVAFILGLYLFFTYFKKNYKFLLSFILGGLLPLLFICFVYIFLNKFSLFLENFFSSSWVFSCNFIITDECYQDFRTYMYRPNTLLEGFPRFLMVLLNLQYLTISSFISIFLFIFLITVFFIKIFEKNFSNSNFLNYEKKIYLFFFSVSATILLHNAQQAHHFIELVPFLILVLAINFKNCKSYFFYFIFIISLIPFIQSYNRFIFDKNDLIEDKIVFYMINNSSVEDQIFYFSSTPTLNNIILGKKYAVNNTYTNLIYRPNQYEKLFGEKINYNNYFDDLIKKNVKYLILKQPLPGASKIFENPLTETLKELNLDAELLNIFLDKYNVATIITDKSSHRYIKDFYEEKVHTNYYYIYKRN